jgi:DNA-binding response OmpR family regulator
MKRERILLIDDEPDILDLLERFLVREGFPVDKAIDGRGALRMMEKSFYNIVLCDIRLPDIDGKNLIARLKEFNPLANIVMITGFTSMDNAVACLGGGAVDYFTKPFRMEELIHAVNELDGKIERWKRMTPLVPALS